MNLQLGGSSLWKPFSCLLTKLLSANYIECASYWVFVTTTSRNCVARKVLNHPNNIYTHLDEAAASRKGRGSRWGTCRVLPVTPWASCTILTECCLHGEQHTQRCPFCEHVVHQAYRQHCKEGQTSHACASGRPLGLSWHRQSCTLGLSMAASSDTMPLLPWSKYLAIHASDRWTCLGLYTQTTSDDVRLIISAAPKKNALTRVLTDRWIPAELESFPRQHLLFRCHNLAKFHHKVHNHETKIDFRAIPIVPFPRSLGGKETNLWFDDTVLGSHYRQCSFGCSCRDRKSFWGSAQTQREWGTDGRWS